MAAALRARRVIYVSALYSCQHFPGARFLGLDSGGHLLLDHAFRIAAEVGALLRASAGR